MCCEIRLRGTQHRHQVLALGATFGTSLNGQPSMVTKELTPQVAQVLARVELEVSQWSRRHLTNDALKIARKILHAIVDLGAFCL
jgi:hypothetical protein